MANNIDKKEPVANCDQSKIDVTKCDNHELAGNIEPLIKVIRGQQVMLDKDLAMLYGVEVKVLNQAVKRNVERFPNDFRFQLTKEECLRSQIVTLNGKQGQHLKYETVLTLLDKRENDVSAVIYTQQISRQFQLDIDRHNAQYAPIDVETFRLSHDRFLCIDDDVYHIGASIKDLGKKWFGFSKMEILTPDELVERINRG